MKYRLVFDDLPERFARSPNPVERALKLFALGFHADSDDEAQRIAAKLRDDLPTETAERLRWHVERVESTISTRP